LFIIVICNIGKKELMKIITRNIIDKTLNKRIENILNDNSNQILLINNIFIDKDTSNILIFMDKKDILVIPNENERKLFEDFIVKWILMISIFTAFYSWQNYMRTKIYLELH